MASTTTISMANKPFRLLDLPTELLLMIVPFVAETCSLGELFKLVSSSQRLYGVFERTQKECLAAVIARLITADRSQPCNIVFAEYVVRLGVMYATKPWPVSLIDIQAALAHAADLSQPLKVNAVLFGDTLAWVKSHLGEPHSRTARYTELLTNGAPLEMLKQRDRFELANGISGVTRGKDGKHRFSHYHLRKGLQKYEMHANVPLRAVERDLISTEGYVPCCLCDECPRFTSV